MFAIFLQSRCHWTLPALRDALAALLANDRDQQSCFLGHFDRNFLKSEEDRLVVDDLERGLVVAELMAAKGCRPPGLRSAVWQ